MRVLTLFILPILCFSFIKSESVYKKGNAGSYYFIILPELNVIPSGSRYNAEMFMCQMAEQRPQMGYSGIPIRVNEQGIGSISFTTRPGSYDENGVSKESFDYYYTINWQGKDTTVHFTKEYWVMKPISLTGNQNKLTLFKGCENKLRVIVPMMPDRFPYSFEAENATLLSTDKKNVKVIYSEADKAKVKIKNATYNKVEETLEFSVVKSPEPVIRIQIDTAKVNYKKGVKISTLDKLNFKIIPDPVFKINYPRDANYSFKEYTLTLMREDKEVVVKNYNVSNPDLTEIKNTAQKGDRLVIEMKGINRTNFQNIIESISITDNTNIIYLY